MDCIYHTFRLKVKHLQQMVNMSCTHSPADCVGSNTALVENGVIRASSFTAWSYVPLEVRPYNVMSDGRKLKRIVNEIYRKEVKIYTK